MGGTLLKRVVICTGVNNWEKKKRFFFKKTFLTRGKWERRKWTLSSSGVRSWEVRNRSSSPRGMSEMSERGGTLPENADERI